MGGEDQRTQVKDKQHITACLSQVSKEILDGSFKIETFIMSGAIEVNPKRSWFKCKYCFL